MQFNVITLFPEIIRTYLKYGILSRACNEDKIAVNTVDLRDFGLGRHRQVDDLSYGGGVGLIFMVEPLFNALESIPKKKKIKSSNCFSQREKMGSNVCREIKKRRTNYSNLWSL